MDARLSALLTAYHDAIGEALALLEKSGIPRPATNTDWAINAIAPSGQLGGGASYRKHGYGCEVRQGERSVDFDFGPNGETGGIDLWRLSEFAGQDLSRHGFSSIEELEAALHASIDAGELVKTGHHYQLRKQAS